jgi:hypothetical protein
MGRERSGSEFAAGADGDGRDRSPFAWGDCVLAEVVKNGYAIDSDVALRLNGGATVCDAYRRGCESIDEPCPSKV